MNESGWSCPHNVKSVCDITKKECNPGDVGCVLFGKAKFSSVESPSNEAFEKRMERKIKKMREEQEKTD